MKRFWIGVGLLVFFLAAGSFLTMGFGRIHGPLAETLEEASALAREDRWQEACTLSEEAREIWEQWRNVTAAVADHAPLEEMDALFSQLECYKELGWEGAFSCACMELAQMARAMQESQQLTWWTLL